MMTKTPPTASKLYIAQTRFLFHCHIKIKIPLDFGENILDECFEILEEIDEKYNSYQPNSYFNLINKHAGNWVNVDDSTIKILYTSQLISELTNGAFDCTSMPLLQLWGFNSTKRKKVPSENEISDVLKNVDFRKIKISNNKVRIEKGQEIITGSFLKAFAVDEVVNFLKENGIRDAIINAGGSTIFALNDDVHPSWFVNVPAVGQQGEFSKRVALSNRCFSLSGKAHNFIEIEGEKFGHILNATTGRPSKTKQVVVISATAFLGDLLSTALFSVDKDNLSDVLIKINQQFDFEYFIVDEFNKNLT